MRIRRAQAADLADVARVLRDAFMEFEHLYTAEGFRATTPGVSDLRARLAEGPLWIARADARVIGTVAAIARDDGLYVRSMAVVPHARGDGVARGLMDEVERFASTVSAARLYLSTTPFLFSAIRLYEALGFRRTGEPPHDLHGTPLFVMAKPLKDRTPAASRRRSVGGAEPS